MSENEINETNETNELMAAIREAFNNGQNSDLDEDSIKIEMISAGATFKNVTRLYNEFMIDAGMASSKEDKENAVKKAVEGNDVSTEEGFDAAVECIVFDLESVNERGAAAMIRAFCKKNETPCFKKQKVASSTPRGDSFSAKFREWIVENPMATKEDFDAFAKENGNENQNTPATKRYFMNIVSMVNEIVKQYKLKV